ncbi:endonuclease/exonuclease/phosphatase family protein [Victivallis sp. Marseille-Q1083]|uniref:endonuclease/exonuclease/phosphatase family protein n=1 Tax=Victivallis sp. Marseille-Q1083 TaxID=2717288 RepID=UPI00158DE562|nr:endonuclease/exonuclease/phosphatase family protein [Victivallis sp. Marseille-Q1083]
MKCFVYGLAVPTVFFSGLTGWTAEVKVMQLNIWRSAMNIAESRQGIVDEIKRLKPEIVLLCECAVDGTISTQLAEMLAGEGLQYQVPKIQNDCQVLSVYPILEEQAISNHLKVVLDGDELGRLVVYSVHLNYKNYACYLPRGYDGNSWQKLPDGPVDTVEPVSRMNLSSGRPDNMAWLIRDAQPALAAGELVILGGDFNEPSHLDWTTATADLFGHNGIAMPWQTTKCLAEAGWLDTYRYLYSDPVKYPGFTFPCNNPHVEVKILTWAPEADERDRIDYIFVAPSERVTVTQAGLIGPETMIVKGQRDTETTADPILPPVSIWPTDHRGTYAVLTVAEPRR